MGGGETERNSYWGRPEKKGKRRKRITARDSIDPKAKQMRVWWIPILKVMTTPSTEKRALSGSSGYKRYGGDWRDHKSGTYASGSAVGPTARGGHGKGSDAKG